MPLTWEDGGDEAVQILKQEGESLDIVLAQSRLLVGVLRTTTRLQTRPRSSVRCGQGRPCGEMTTLNRSYHPEPPPQFS
jgi:hypothetical protein